MFMSVSKFLCYHLHLESAMILAVSLLPLSLLGQATSPGRDDINGDLGKICKYEIARYVDSTGREIIVVTTPVKPPAVKMPAVFLPKTFAKGATMALEVPAFDWTYGCSATSAGMMFGYYDRNGYPNMWADGNCPMDNSQWGHTAYPGITCGECPFVASHQGIAGRTDKGFVDDYWIDYGSIGDPYYGNWSEHTPQDCTGDFMRTGQYYHDFNCMDGGTRFSIYTNGDPTPYNDLKDGDGTYGMAAYVQSRSYTVTTAFTQLIKGAGTDPDKGFTYENYQTEIDAGRPVLIQVEGHTMIGVGYDTTDSMVYIHDTWDYEQHEMPWAGSYSGMEHYAVTVMQIEGGGGGTVLEVSPLTLSQTCQFGQNANSQSFSVWNSGNGSMSFTVSDDVDWLSCSPGSGTSTGPADKTSVLITYSSESLEPGTYTTNITVNADSAENSPQTVKVTLMVLRQAEISLDKTVINVYCNLGTDAASESFHISNLAEETTLSYELNSNVDWMTLLPKTGSITGTGKSDEIVIDFNTETLPLGQYKGYVNIAAANTSNSPQTVIVVLSVGSLNQVPYDQGEAAVLFSDTPDSASYDILNNVNYWTDSSGRGNSLFQNAPAKRPVMINALKGVPVLYFNGKSSLQMLSSRNINSDGPYSEKSVALFFRTGSDIDTRQIIFEQGDFSRGFNIYLDSKRIYFSVWNAKNDAGPNTAWGPLFTYGSIAPNTGYAVSILIDAISGNLSAYLDGVPLESKGGVGRLYSSSESVSVGGVTGTTRFHDRKKSSSGFTGYIGAFLYYNQLLSFQQTISLSKYLKDKFKDNFTDLDEYCIWFSSESGISFTDQDKLVKSWLNLAKDRKLRMSQSSKSKRPLWVDQPLAGDDKSLLFNGLDNLLLSNSSPQMNSSDKPYQEKTLLLKFKTGEDVLSRQLIWGQGNEKTGLSIYIQNASVFLGAWDLSGKKGANSWGPVFVSDEIAKNSVHYAGLIFNANQNSVEGYLDGISLGIASGVGGGLSKHPPASIGASLTALRFADGTSKGNFFKGSICQAIMYNCILDSDELEYLNLYFSGSLSSIAMNLPKNDQGQYALNLISTEGQNPSPAVFQVWNSLTTGNLEFTVTGEEHWFSCSPTEGISEGENDKVPITVSFKASALKPGTYSSAIQISAENTINSPISILLTLTILE